MVNGGIMLISLIASCLLSLNGPSYASNVYKNLSITQIKEARFPYYVNFTLDDVASCFHIESPDGYKTQIFIQGFEFSSFIGLVGVYPIKAIAQDEKMNKSYINTEIVIYDDLVPLIKGPDEICIEENSALKRKDLLSFYSSRDEIDYACPVKIGGEDYSEEKREKGIYNVSLSAMDKSDNEARKVIFIKSVSLDETIYIKENCHFRCLNNVPLLPMDVLEALKRSGQADEKCNYAEYTSGNYPYKEGRIFNGSYGETIKVFSLDGTELFFDLSFVVSSSEEKEEKNQFLEVFLSFFAWLKKLFLSLIEWLKGLF